MSHKEFTGWKAFYAVEPFGVRRDNLHAALIASTVANCHSKKTYKADDFMLKDEEERRKQATTTFITGLRALSKKKSDA